MDNSFKLDRDILGRFFVMSAVKTALVAGVGYILGHVVKTSPSQVAVVFAIGTIVERASLLYCVAANQDRNLGDKKFKIMKEFMKVFLERRNCIFFVSCTTAFYFKRMELMASYQAVALAALLTSLTF
jgi:hypothetical protein